MDTVSCPVAAVLKALISLLAALRRHHAKNGMTATMMAQALGPLVLRPEQNAAAQDNMDLVVDEAVSAIKPDTSSASCMGYILHTTTQHFASCLGSTAQSISAHLPVKHCHIWQKSCYYECGVTHEKACTLQTTSLQVEGMAAMIRHCDALFGSYFGGDTHRTHQSQQTPKAKPQRSTDRSQPDPAQPDSLITARQYPDGAENQSVGPGGLNTHYLQHKPQALHKQGSANKHFAPLGVPSTSSHSSDSDKSVRLRSSGRHDAGSAPVSPNKRQQGSFGRASAEQPWLPGNKVDKALQKDGFRSISFATCVYTCIDIFDDVHGTLVTHVRCTQICIHSYHK